jgi:hypothetical protein
MGEEIDVMGFSSRQTGRRGKMRDGNRAVTTRRIPLS